MEDKILTEIACSFFNEVFKWLDKLAENDATWKMIRTEILFGWALTTIRANNHNTNTCSRQVIPQKLLSTFQ